MVADEGSFAIHQRTAGWYGFGLDHLISAVRGQKSRYQELKWPDYHHSEEIAYIDRLEHGGLMCLTSRQSTGKDHLHSTYIEIFLPGIPVDMSSIRRLCALTHNSTAILASVNENPVKTLTFRPKIEVEAEATIVSHSNGREWVSGVIVKNPFLKIGFPSGDNPPVRSPFTLLTKHDFIVCALPHWHGPGLMERYHLRYAEACWIEHIPGFYIACDW